MPGLNDEMTPAPSPREDRQAWCHESDGVLAIGVQTQLPGYGEDAEPLLLHHVPTGEGLIGAFDGAGGAGAAMAYRSPQGKRRSGAWVGARVARAEVQKWFHTVARGQGPYDVELLRRHLHATLAQWRSPTRSKIVGTMRRELPTTMAAVLYRPRGSVVDCQVLWAGDSRAYVLAHNTGLHPLSRDHTVETDALEQLLQDPPMTNVICADRHFEIETRQVALDLPTVLVCATDGFFGYVATPAQFEWHLLNTLQQADNGLDWAKRLAGRVVSYSADDASLSLVASGYRDFRTLRAGFSRRADYVFRSYSGPPVGTVGQDGGLRRWQAETWDKYRPNYELWLRQVDEDNT
ncbi:protein phosphatase 2C domain-containing protein [Amycolatopsis sp. NPDC059021]|uniref:protein phosphatase 2C domain-containing protein n=1 Tax=Amycolatopsis sp. NPDC059021 TaxID=3346704 RepID=UPI00366BDC11